MPNPFKNLFPRVHNYYCEQRQGVDYKVYSLSISIPAGIFRYLSSLYIRIAEPGRFCPDLDPAMFWKPDLDPTKTPNWTRFSAGVRRTQSSPFLTICRKKENVLKDVLHVDDCEHDGSRPLPLYRPPALPLSPVNHTTWYSETDPSRFRWFGWILSEVQSCVSG